jgi:hypothetical protein
MIKKTNKKDKCDLTKNEKKLLNLAVNDWKKKIEMETSQNGDKKKYLLKNKKTIKRRMEKFDKMIKNRTKKNRRLKCKNM